MLKNLLILLFSIFLLFSCSKKNEISLVSEPNDEESMINVYKEAVDALIDEMTDVTRSELFAKLTGNGRFVWLARNLTPKQHYRLNRLGLPGISFQNSEKRVYPHGKLVSHVLGLTDVDGRGVAGLESHFDDALRKSVAPLRTSIDLRVQSLLRDELMAAIKKFKAIGAAGVVMEVTSGEI